jgi:hypothetical protein
MGASFPFCPSDGIIIDSQSYSEQASAVLTIGAATLAVSKSLNVEVMSHLMLESNLMCPRTCTTLKKEGASWVFIGPRLSLDHLLGP